MCLGLSLCHDLENTSRQLFYFVRGLQTVNNGVNVIEVSVGVRMHVIVSMLVIMFMMIVVMISMVVSMLMVVAMFVAVLCTVFVNMGMCVFVIMIVVLMFMVVMILMFFILQMHVKIIGLDTAFLRCSKMQMIAVYTQTCKGIFQYLSVCSQVKKRSYGHITANS